jgi:ferric-dicitrate binding protein FerR (iron transport regulator)
MAPGSLVIHVMGRTAMTVPQAPRRGRAAEAKLDSGQVRVTTGPAFAGARLVFETPEAIVRASGTTYAVIREPAGTCVCVFDGMVEVGPKGRKLERVEHGRRGFVFTDGRIEHAEIRYDEIGQLGAFRDRNRPRLQSDARK